ncbi:hypothetical protein CALVIDRAFT_600008 [Calocera viscosa TUFC12733]|uniref:Uncharacterized protein n=1 Tax=Calocera viscosa (strain TUFC12733) TaxID=1330018 RepID=A0A167K7N2_CALVF|nr:hypothetical protein CALVIDRAFT_600008 [Calocera viscosa TUFC12733]
MYCTLLALLFGLAIADPTAPPKARRSSASCDFYACPSTDLPGADLSSVEYQTFSPPVLGCGYADSNGGCQYNYMTGQLVTGSVSVCSPATCVPQQPPCAAYYCPVLPSYPTLDEVPTNYDSQLGVECIYETATGPFFCGYLTGNGQLVVGGIGEGNGVLPCPVIATCTSTGPSRRRAYLEPDGWTMHEEARASKANDFEDAYQPW